LKSPDAAVGMRPQASAYAPEPEQSYKAGYIKITLLLNIKKY